MVVQGVSADDVRGVRVLDDVTLRVGAGQVVVIAGVEGNGQTGSSRSSRASRRARCAASAAASRSTVGRPDPGRRARRGLAVVAAPDRQRDGIVGPLELWENLVLACDELRATAPRGWIARDARSRGPTKRLRAFGVRPPDPTLPVASLSGGNQQRVVLAPARPRSAARGDRGEPLRAGSTRGDCGGARTAPRARRVGCRDPRCSTDLDEVAALGGDVHVLYRGRLLGPLPASASRLEIGRLMAGLGAAA